MKKTKILLLAVLILALVLVVGSVSYLYLVNGHSITGQAVYQDSIKVKIGYRAHLLYLPAYVALKNNYFAEQGLQAELIKFDSTNQLVEAVLTGDIDAAIGGVNTLVPLEIEGKTPGQLKIFNLGYLTNNFDALLVSADSNIKSVQDLKGKTISSLPGTAAKIWMERMLEKENLNGKVNIIQTADSQQLNALSSGSADAIFVLEPLVTIAEEKKIGRVLVKSPITTYFTSNLLFETSVMSADFVKKNPGTAKKIITAVDKAIVYINNNPDTVRAYYSEFTPVEDSFEQKLPVTRYVPSSEMNYNEFQKAVELFFTSGLIKQKVDISDVLVK